MGHRTASNGWEIIFSFEPNVDTIFIAGYLMAAYFFLEYALGDRRARTLALGGLAAGGALGTKATAIVFGDGRLTFDELNRRANRIAWRLRERGVGPGTLVAIMMEKSLDLVPAVLGDDGLKVLDQAP